MHTTWSDELDSPTCMVEMAVASGYAYSGFTDHEMSLWVAQGLAPMRLAQQGALIDWHNAR
jgi:histidinol phosphatase-like PHP family hydrolase